MMAAVVKWMKLGILGGQGQGQGRRERKGRAKGRNEVDGSICLEPTMNASVEIRVIQVSMNLKQLEPGVDDDLCSSGR